LALVKEIKNMMKFIRPHLGLVLLILISSIAIRPLFHEGFFPIHDNTQVARVYELYKSLSSGLVPVRWVADLGYGYGYPIFSFYAPLAYYIGASFIFLGLSALVATKIMIGLAVISAGITMYYLMREITDEWSGLIAGVLYVYAPYHALNLYVRGAVGELWAYAFIPLAFFGFLRIARSPSWLSITLAVLGFSGVILSHNLTALMVSPFLLLLIVYLIYKNSSRYARLAIFSAFFLSLAVSSWYWLPAIGEIQYVNVGSVIGGGSDYIDHYVCFSQLWTSQWGFAGSGPGCVDGISFQLGKIHILLAMFGIALSFLLQKKRGTAVFIGVVLFLSVFLMLPISRPIWDSLGFMKYLQFPWRFLQLSMFFLSLLGGLGFYLFIKYLIPAELKKPYLLLMTMGLTIIVVSFYAKLFKPQEYIEQYRDETNVAVLNWTISKISDEYLPPSFNKPRSEGDIPNLSFKPNEVITIFQVEDSPGRLMLKTTSGANSRLTPNRAVFPGWEISLDNKPASFVTDDGLYSIYIPAGEHVLRMEFIQTPLEKLANSISVVGITVLFIGIIRKKSLFNI